MEPWYYGLILFFAGAVAGFLNVLAGGGSLLTVPIMVFMGIPGPVANGTNRIGILVQNIVSVATFFKRGFSDFKLSLTLSVMSIPGAIAGAMLGTELDGIWFNRILALIMLAVMVIMALEKRYLAIRVEGEISRTRFILAHLAMIGIGFYGGFIQIGVGFIIMPVLQRILGLDLVRVNMHKVFIVGVFTVVALIVFASRVEILWFLGGCLALGNALGGWFGTHMSVVKGERLIRIVLNTVLVIFIIKLLFFS